jgi:hypothetical protein
MNKYRASLRTEADWLWGNMTYAQANPLPDAAHCTPKVFTHEPVVMDAAARADDVAAGKLVDRLDYAATLINQAHAQWDTFCQGNISPVNLVAFLDSRLRPAYDNLSHVESTLVLRGAPTSTPIFQE